MQYFNFAEIAREARIPDDKLDELCEFIRQEFPKDDMMYELHVLRACMAIRDGYIQLEDIISAKLLVSEIHS